jgi:transposase
MLGFPPSIKIYMSGTPVDMRRGFDGLSSLVTHSFGRDVFSGHLFIFWGQRRDRVKILFWDRGGYVLYYKRLERGRFRIPCSRAEAPVIEMDGTELSMLLDGIDMTRVRRPRHWQPHSAQRSQ